MSRQKKPLICVIPVWHLGMEPRRFCSKHLKQRVLVITRPITIYRRQQFCLTLGLTPKPLGLLNGPGRRIFKHRIDKLLNALYRLVVHGGIIGRRLALTAEVRLYDHLFSEMEPDKIEIPASLNPGSLEVLTDCKLEPGLKDAQAGERFQFLRMGYFFTDPKDSQPGAPVFNRTTTLRDTWAKIQKKG